MLSRPCALTDPPGWLLLFGILGLATTVEGRVIGGAFGLAVASAGAALTLLHGLLFAFLLFRRLGLADE